ncbi:MAG TPA: hypothetical protein VNV25_07660 [Gemmatimonadaceae bacterium]|nr:hypothetical protein [Gemmatimonadaceae bacterium]
MPECDFENDAFELGHQPRLGVGDEGAHEAQLRGRKRGRQITDGPLKGLSVWQVLAGVSQLVNGTLRAVVRDASCTLRGVD